MTIKESYEPIMENVGKKLEALYTELNTQTRIRSELKDRLDSIEKHVLRLEGAIQILQTIQQETQTTETQPELPMVNRDAFMKR